MASISSTVCRSPVSRAVSSFLGTAASTATRQRCNALPLRHSAVRTHAIVRNVQSSSKASVTLLHHRRSNARSMVTITKTEAGSAPVPPPQVTVTQSSSDDTSTSGDEDIIITASCAQQIKRLAAKRPDGGDSLYLRLYVDAGGCSGFEYKYVLLLLLYLVSIIYRLVLYLCGGLGLLPGSPRRVSSTSIFQLPLPSARRLITPKVIITGPAVVLLHPTLKKDGTEELK